MFSFQIWPCEKENNLLYNNLVFSHVSYHKRGATTTIVNNNFTFAKSFLIILTDQLINY